MATASLRATLLRCSPSFQAGHPLLDRREQTDPSYSIPVAGLDGSARIEIAGEVGDTTPPHRLILEHGFG
jgi:hypothetical protein